MFRVYERQTLRALLILSLEDAFARVRSGPNTHPRPFEPLQFYLVQGEVGGAVTVFDPPVLLDVIRNPSGYHLFFGREKLRAERRGPGRLEQPPTTRLLNLPDGKYTLNITSPFYQTAQAAFELPTRNANQPGVMETKYSLDLQPSYAYPFPDTFSLGQVPAGSCTADQIILQRGPTLLRGVLLDTSGNGIRGASVRVVGLKYTYLTDETGQWVIWFLDRKITGPVTVHFEIPDKPPQDVTNVCVARGCETALHQTALRGWVRKGRIGLAGAAVTVSGQQGTALTGLDGGWTFVLPFSQVAGKVTVRVTLPDGSSQTRDEDVIPRATRTVDTFQFP